MPAMVDRRLVLFSIVSGALAGSARAEDFDSDPFGSLQWPDLRREFFGSARVEFDARVQVRGPGFAEDPMNVPIGVSAAELPEVEAIVVIVDRNPIRKVLEYIPVAALARLSFRFKLEQASPVRAAARTRDGVWHVGGTWVDSSGGGCTVAGATRKDGSWTQTLGQVNAKLFPNGPAPDASGTRLRVLVMHPMDTGLVGGIPAFYVKQLAVRDAQGRELLRLNTFEPVSENPVFSFDFAGRLSGALRLSGTDNNGNRIDSRIE
jgi:sulfur-oxidizing protein SoxY